MDGWVAGSFVAGLSGNPNHLNLNRIEVGNVNNKVLLSIFSKSFCLICQCPSIRCYRVQVYFQRGITMNGGCDCSKPFVSIYIQHAAGFLVHFALPFHTSNNADSSSSSFFIHNCIGRRKGFYSFFPSLSSQLA